MSCKLIDAIKGKYLKIHSPSYRPFQSLNETKEVLFDVFYSIRSKVFSKYKKTIDGYYKKN